MYKYHLPVAPNRMATTTTQFHRVTAPRPFTAAEVREMPEPKLRVPDDVFLVAVAAAGGAAGAAEDRHDAALVLYLSPDGDHALERVVARANPETPHKIPAAVHAEPTLPELGEPSEATVRAYESVVEAHREAWLDVWRAES